jgi:hypothetical protein
LIRKLSIGLDLKNNAMHYIVGQSVLENEYKIHLIKDTEKGVEIYVINEKSEIMLWKDFNNHVAMTKEYITNY